MLNGAFELLNTQYNNLLGAPRSRNSTKIPKLTTTDPDKFDIWFDQVKRVWEIEKLRMPDSEFTTLVYLSTANSTHNRIKRILDTKLYNAPGTCDAFLDELQKAFEDPAAKEKALLKIQTIRQGKSKIDDHIQKLEDLPSLAQGDNLLKPENSLVQTKP
ncbi:hypothetical protein HOO65_050286 [Ceratocystis lukuohia]|uniref:Retrotransposon gag domain-containing protein n=1 Tax=Ceratocystis lukuohia TaxID=2019550 RepID=A0ABR4MFX1_9PEZI